MGLSETDVLDVEQIREDFPILEREFDGEQLVYLDNAATSQTPEPVVETIADYYRHTNANVHRGLHSLSQEASVAYEDAHAHDTSEILNEFGVAVRAGHHCTQPLHDKLGIAASTRASFYLYNTREEVDVLVEALDATRELFA